MRPDTVYGYNKADITTSYMLKRNKPYFNIYKNCPNKKHVHSI